jgi:uncharacterized membrane protein YphA (DoxX/SURF4 family)
MSMMRLGQIGALLFIAVLAEANVRPVLQSTRFGYGNKQMKAVKVNAAAIELAMAQPDFQEEAKFVHKKMNAMLADQSILVEAKRIGEQMEALMALPNVQEQVKAFAEHVEVSIQEQMKHLTKNMGTMQADDTKIQEQAVEQMKIIIAKSVTEQMEVLSADPSFQKQAKVFATQMEVMSADPKTQVAEQLQNTQSKMVEKMFDRRLMASSSEHVGLQSTTLGKPSSVSVQPGAGMKSIVDPRSMRASSGRSTIRAGALLPRLKVIKDTVDDPKRSRFVATSAIFQRKKSMPEPEEEEDEDEFISEELEENIRETAYLFMRLAVASVMIHHGQEKLLSAEAFTKFAIDKYFSFLPALGGSRVIWAYGAGAAQFAGPILLSLGVFSRLAALSMAGTMVGATYYSVVTTGLEGFPLSKMASRVPVFHNYGFETPVLYFAIFLIIFATGPGKLSVAQALGWNDDKSLFGKIKQ